MSRSDKCHFKAGAFNRSCETGCFPGIGAEMEIYRGGLLGSVLRNSTTRWRETRWQREKVNTVVTAAEALPQPIPGEL